MPRTPIEVRPWNTRTSVTAKRMHWPCAVVSSTSSFSVQICTSTMPSPSSSFMAMMPERRTSTKSDSLLRRTVPLVVANITSRLPQVALVLGQRHDRGDELALLDRQDVDQRLAARLRRRDRQPPDLFLVDAAERGEEQHRRMRRGDEQPRDEILVARLHAGAALAAAALRPVGRQRHALDVAEMRHGHHHVLAVDQVLVLDLALLLGDHGAARRGELVSAPPCSSSLTIAWMRARERRMSR